MKLIIDEDTKKTFRAYLAYGVVVFFILYFVHGYYIGYLIDHGCSTIGKTIRYETGGNGNTFIVYEYYVNNVRYEGHTQREKGIGLNECFNVKYLCDDPDESGIYFDKKIEKEEK